MANLATQTGAFNVRYLFDSESGIRGFDHHVGVELKAPDYVMNYFGMGNKSTKDDSFDDSYYRLDVNQLILNYALGYRWGKSAFREMKEGKINQSEVRLGVFLKRSHIEEQEDHFISDLEHNGLIKDDLYPLLFSGIYGQYSYSNLDREVNPQRGYQLDLSGEQFFPAQPQTGSFSPVKCRFQDLHQLHKKTKGRVGPSCRRFQRSLAIMLFWKPQSLEGRPI